VLCLRATPERSDLGSFDNRIYESVNTNDPRLDRSAIRDRIVQRSGFGSFNDPLLDHDLYLLSRLSSIPTYLNLHAWGRATLALARLRAIALPLSAPLGRNQESAYR
jgi:hypothetical protein